MTRKIDEIIFKLADTAYSRGQRNVGLMINRPYMDETKQQLLEAILECLPRKKKKEFIQKSCGIEISRVEDKEYNKIYNQCLEECKRKVGELFK